MNAQVAARSSILIGSAGKGKGARACRLPLAFANRHGLIAGATGTGKTVTLRVLAEGFSDAGVPVFLADVKGDLSGLRRPAEPTEALLARAAATGVAGYEPCGYPVVFWDAFGARGHPLRATVSEIGPVLLARMLELGEVQEGVLNVAFRVADEQGLLLLDLKDLQALLAFVGERADELTVAYGNVSKASVGAIQRRLLVLEQQGAEAFFGEPALDLGDLMRVDAGGRGAVSVLSAERLFQSPRLYATVLLWLLSELYENLPEAGDLEKPKLAFFFDEAHLLFADAPKALLEKVEQVVRLIRSKGVGVYFATQSPLDIPDRVLGQLGNRVQHALRAHTPKDAKALAAVAETFPPAAGLDVAKALPALAVGEALATVLEGNGVPSPTARVTVRPPASRLRPLDDDERRQAIDTGPLFGRYEDALDRESAYELLTGRATAEDARPQDGGVLGRARDKLDEMMGGGGQGAPAPGPWGKPAGGGLGGAPKARGRQREGLGEALAKSAARAIGSQIGRQIVRGLLGGLLRGGR